MRLIVVKFTKEKEELASEGDFSVLNAINKIIKNYYLLIVSDSITVGDFLVKLTKKANLENEIDPYVKLYEKYNFYTNHGLIEPDLEMKLMDFLRNFSIKTNDIQLYWGVCVGGGAGVSFKNIVIRINSREGGHERIPHVHIYRNKYTSDGNYVRMSLINIKEMDGGLKLKDLFDRKEIELIIRILKEYKLDFTDYYNKIRLGANPKTFFISVDGELYDFK